MTATLVRFPKSVLERIDALVGNKRRAEFIRDVVEAEVERREQGRKIAKAKRGRTIENG